jgi:hypothetical protein
VGGCGFHSTSLGLGPVAGSYERTNEPLGSVNGVEVLLCAQEGLRYMDLLL